MMVCLHIKFANCKPIFLSLPLTPHILAFTLKYVEHGCTSFPGEPDYFRYLLCIWGYSDRHVSFLYPLWNFLSSVVRIMVLPCSLLAHSDGPGTSPDSYFIRGELYYQCTCSHEVNSMVHQLVLKRIPWSWSIWFVCSIYRFICYPPQAPIYHRSLFFGSRLQLLSLSLRSHCTSRIADTTNLLLLYIGCTLLFSTSPIVTDKTGCY